jgi:heptosyltransferase I
LRRRQFDLVLDLQCLLRSGLMARASGARRRVGLGSAREGARWFYTDIVPVPDYDTTHAVDRYWRVAEALGIDDQSLRFHVPIPERARTWAAEMLANQPRPWIMVGPGSRWQTKRWPPTHFAQLVDRARRRFGGTAILVGGHDEMTLAGEVKKEMAVAGVLDLTGRTSLPQLAAVLERADLMIANDTGPLHLAAALGRPVAAPYTCTSVLQTGPYGQKLAAVQTTVWCQASYLKRCNRMECMAELTPDRLWPQVNEVLQRWQMPRAVRPA